MKKNEMTEILKMLGFQIIEIHDSIGSTNIRASEIAQETDINLGIVITDNQISGKGRGSRKWDMKPGSGLAFTIILGDVKNIKNILGITTGLGAIAVTQAVEELYEIPAKIKWPNDVLINGKKFCGILTEGTWLGSDLKSLIIGIGINVSEDSIPEEIIFPATALEKEFGSEVSKTILLELIVKKFLEMYKERDSKEIINFWEEVLAFKGLEVILHNEKQEIFSGELIGLDEKGGIEIRNKDDQKNVFYYGDIHLAVK